MAALSLAALCIGIRVRFKSCSGGQFHTHSALYSAKGSIACIRGTVTMAQKPVTWLTAWQIPGKLGQCRLVDAPFKFNDGV